MSNSFTNSGPISGSNINIGSTLTNVVQSVRNGLPSADPSDRETLAKLLEDLQTQLKSVPEQVPDQTKDAATLERRAKELIDEASAEEPDKVEVEERSNKFKKAAENIGKALPVVAGLVPQIVSIIGNIIKWIGPLLT